LLSAQQHSSGGAPFVTHSAAPHVTLFGFDASGFDAASLPPPSSPPLEELDDDVLLDVELELDVLSSLGSVLNFFPPSFAATGSSELHPPIALAIAQATDVPMTAKNTKRRILEL